MFMNCRAMFGLMGYAALVLVCGSSPSFAQVKGLGITAPSSPGSGYDQVARAMQAVLQENGLATGVQVSNIAAAAGLSGLLSSSLQSTGTPAYW